LLGAFQQRWTCSPRLLHFPLFPKTSVDATIKVEEDVEAPDDDDDEEDDKDDKEGDDDDNEDGE
jgi:hypothetical protein